MAESKGPTGAILAEGRDGRAGGMRPGAAGGALLSPPRGP